MWNMVYWWYWMVMEKMNSTIEKGHEKRNS